MCANKFFSVAPCLLNRPCCFSPAHYALSSAQLSQGTTPWYLLVGPTVTSQAIITRGCCKSSTEKLTQLFEFFWPLNSNLCCFTLKHEKFPLPIMCHIGHLRTRHAAMKRVTVTLMQSPLKISELRLRGVWDHIELDLCQFSPFHTDASLCSFCTQNSSSKPSKIQSCLKGKPEMATHQQQSQLGQKLGLPPPL